ncbi:Prolyl 3-hydroxylase 1 [Eumeta japonica]|uniref:Prolyl 3-hydroxylase 1 n=1 Tax=Eumeta variegata TaxID=151549 RepID=A0A4C1WDY8_EUMVA|nr:Prolyl 3-hydroxylase 1 [Eumeta japonica]
MYMLPKAATAAYTYLITNPDNKVMWKNYHYYIEQPEVDQKEVIDLESLEFIVSYKLGKDSYQQKNWGETIAAMEEALNKYIHFENDCRFECEEHTHVDGSQHFINAVASNTEYILNCKQKCQDEVKQLSYSSGSEFIADVLNYLQISYYHLNKIEDGAKAVASYLLIYPNDEDMIENKKIYSSLINEDAFIVRNDIVNYVERDNSEKKLLEFIQSNNESYEVHS